jgi:hypothetical protein
MLEGEIVRHRGPAAPESPGGGGKTHE